MITGLSEHLAPSGLTAESMRKALPDDMAVPVRGREPMRACDFFDTLAAGDEKVYLRLLPP